MLSIPVTQMKGLIRLAKDDENQVFLFLTIGNNRASQTYA